MPWATYSIISKSLPNTRMLQNTLSMLPLQAWQPNYNNSLNSWPALLPLWPSLHLQYLHLPWSWLLYLNSEQGQNSPLSQTSPVNEILVELSLTSVRCICTWPQSSLVATRKKSSELLLFSRMKGLPGGPKTSFTRKRILVFFPFNPGPTLNGSSRVSSFQSTRKRM